MILKVLHYYNPENFTLLKSKDTPKIFVLYFKMIYVIIIFFLFIIEKTLPGCNRLKLTSL